MTALLWPLFERSSWAQPAMCWRARNVRAALSPLFARSAWAQPVTVEAGRTFDDAVVASVCSVGVSTSRDCGSGNESEGSSLASDSLVGVGSTSHYVGGHDRRWRWSGLYAWSTRAEPLWWRARQLRAQISPLFVCSVCAQEATVLAGMNFEGTTLASVRSVGVGSSSFCGSGQDI